MKLEAVDRRNPCLMYVATVADIVDDRVRVHFDSWDDSFDYWWDIRMCVLCMSSVQKSSYPCCERFQSSLLQEFFGWFFPCLSSTWIIKLASSPRFPHPVWSYSVVTSRKQWQQTRDGSEKRNLRSFRVDLYVCVCVGVVTEKSEKYWTKPSTQKLWEEWVGVLWKPVGSREKCMPHTSWNRLWQAVRTYWIKPWNMQ